MLPAMTPSRNDPLPQRRHRKMLRDGSSEVWPQDAENVFLDGLREYWNSPWANFSRGRSRWRNQFLVDYLKKVGIERTKKQVASHIQVLRNMWKGHPEFCLVAGPDELNAENIGSSSTSDGQSPPGRRLSSPPASSSPHRSSIASSPPSTPQSYDSESASDASPRLPSRRDTIRPNTLTLGSPVNVSMTHVPVKSELSPTLHHPFDQSPPMHAISDPCEQPQELHLINMTRVCGLGLWTDGMEPIYIDVDTLPSSMASTSVNPAGPCSSPVIRTSLRMKLGIPSSVDIDAPDNLRGFNGAVSFTSPVPPTARCLTKVHVDGTCISREIANFIPVAPPPPSPHGDQSEQKFAALLPDSWLSRCRWLDTGSKKTLVTQQVILDEDVLFVVIYDLYRVKHSAPSAELVIWHKHIDASALSPTSTNFTNYPFNPCVQSASHDPHTFGTSPPSPTSPIAARGCSASQSLFPTAIDPWATSLLPLF